MGDALTSLRKIDLINLIEKMEKDHGAKVSDLEEENRLLMIQLEDVDTIDVDTPATAPKGKKKKLSDMNEFELSRYMSTTTSKKIL